jgi:ATP-dependent Clp protease ATP-binding subunit ClpA
MFERFTHEAREAVTRAVERASKAKAGSIDTEHLLLGVAGGTGLAARVLAEAGATEEAVADALARWDEARLLGSLGIDVEEVRASVERTFGPGAWAGDAGGPSGTGRRKGGHIPFTADAKKALELSLREALNLRSKGIEAGHILLGLLRVGGRVTEALGAIGVDAAGLRQRMVEAMQQAS